MPYAYKIEPGNKVSLKHYNPDHDEGLTHPEGLAAFHKLNHELDILQEEMYAAGANSILMIVQAPDTGGKDGTIRNVLVNVNPQGCQVEAFKVPTEEELGHDFLWRAHKVVPRKGMLGVFNRSYYEDVLVVRVHKLVPESVWKARYDQINAFERMLAANGTVIRKFFLYISKDEQERRLLAREEDVEKAWKLSAGDWKEREYWDDYMRAYEDAISKCNTEEAPWYIVPANKKWFRDLAVCEVLVEAMKEKRRSWDKTLKEMSKARLAELAAMRAKGYGV
jgi:PPK2 family polyphosphate:nucleotide phosphotransferase